MKNKTLMVTVYFQKLCMYARTYVEFYCNVIHFYQDTYYIATPVAESLAK